MIDIIIPAYNCAATLGRTLSSLVAQTDQNFNTIVVDDCSTQDITPIINDYNSKLNLTYIRHETNQGCGMTRQTGADAATSEYFSFLDSDDMFMPYTVELFNSTSKANPKIDFFHSYFYEQFNTGEQSGFVFRKEGFIWCHGKLYKKAALEEFDIRSSPLVKWADDSYLNSQCTELLNMAVIAMPTVVWTNTQTSVTREKNEFRDKNINKDFIEAMILSCEKVRRFKHEIEHLERTIAKIEREFGELSEEEKELLNKLKGYRS